MAAAGRARLKVKASLKVKAKPEGKPAGARQRELPAAVRSADHGEAGKPLGALCVGQGTSRQV